MDDLVVLYISLVTLPISAAIVFLNLKYYCENIAILDRLNRIETSSVEHVYTPSPSPSPSAEPEEETEEEKEDV